MSSNRAVERYMSWYARLLRFYPSRHRERFGESMRQTFGDLCRERAAEGRASPGFAFRIFVETSAGIARENVHVLLTQNRGFVRLALAVAVVLSVPLVAMQFTHEVVWSVFDFAFAGIVLLGIGVAYVIASRMSRRLPYRVAAGVALATTLLLIWLNVAVGVIGTEDEAINLLYGGVLAVGIAGAIIARFQPQGMVRALLATAVAQMLVAVIALLAGKQDLPYSSVSEILALNGGFAVLWVASALLFWASATGSTPSGSP